MDSSSKRGSASVRGHFRVRHFAQFSAYTGASSQRWCTVRIRCMPPNIATTTLTMSRFRVRVLRALLARQSVARKTDHTKWTRCNPQKEFRLRRRRGDPWILVSAERAGTAVGAVSRVRAAARRGHGARRRRRAAQARVARPAERRVAPPQWWGVGTPGYKLAPSAPVGAVCRVRAAGRRRRQGPGRDARRKRA